MSEADNLEVARTTQTQTSERWHTILPDGTVWSSGEYGSLQEALDRERKTREWFTTMYAELVMNGVESTNYPPAPALEIVRTKTTVTTTTETVIVDRHVIDHTAEMRDA
jgi:hypothetical protein